MKITAADFERFWSNVEITDECWNWKGMLGRGGYGIISLHCKKQSTHRLSYHMTHGPIPEGMFVCHRCDNRRCVRPTHLWLGTVQDNNADRHQKGRSIAPSGDDHYARKNPERSGFAKNPLRRRGVEASAAKLTPEIAAQIRQQYIPGVVTGRELGKQYGVGSSTIYRIVKGKTWND